MEIAQNNTHALPNVLFIGKRFYTNRDTLVEKYGRIFNLPSQWASIGISTRLWLIDYHSRQKVQGNENSLSFTSSPIFTIDIFKRLISYFLFSRQFTHIVASGDSYIGLLGYFIAKRNKAAFIFDVYDKYDDFTGYVKFAGIDIFPFLLKHADQRLFASRALLEQLGNPDSGDQVVANGLETNTFRPLDIHDCRENFGLPNNLIFVGYFGSMEPDRGVQDLIEAVAQLRRSGLAIELLIGGKRNPDIDIDVDGVRYVGNIPFHQMPTILAACNLIAIPYRRSSLMDAGASNKIVEALACNRPVVATRTPNLMANFPTVAYELKERLAEPGNALDIARVILAQLREPIIGTLPTGWDWESIALKSAKALDLVREDKEAK